MSGVRAEGARQSAAARRCEAAGRRGRRRRAAGVRRGVRPEAARGLFQEGRADRCRLLARFVPIGSTRRRSPRCGRSRCGLAKPDAVGCVLLLGLGLAPARELAAAIAEQRRKSRQAAVPVLVPVDVRDWDALVPPETPAIGPQAARAAETRRLSAARDTVAVHPRQRYSFVHPAMALIETRDLWKTYVMGDGGDPRAAAACRSRSSAANTSRSWGRRAPASPR